MSITGKDLSIGSEIYYLIDRWGERLKIGVSKVKNLKESEGDIIINYDPGFYGAQQTNLVKPDSSIITVGNSDKVFGYVDKGVAAEELKKLALSRIESAKKEALQAIDKIKQTRVDNWDILNQSEIDTDTLLNQLSQVA